MPAPRPGKKNRNTKLKQVRLLQLGFILLIGFCGSTTVYMGAKAQQAIQSAPLVEEQSAQEKSVQEDSTRETSTDKTQQETDLSEEDFSLDTVANTLEKTVVDIWYNFIGHIPYIVAALAVLIISGFLAYALGRVVRQMTKRSHMRNSLRELLERMTRISVWIFGFLLAAMVLFPGLTPAKALGGLGLASVAIGFAFKEIFENFFAGILLLWKYPFERGDYIECESIMGRVEDISVRMSQLRQTTGELVVVPNSFLFKNPVFVLTDRDRRRISLVVGVAYDEDADEAIAVIEKVMESVDSVDQNRPVQVFLKAFGGSSMDIEVTWWTDSKPVGLRKSRNQVVAAIKRALDEAGIEIPFPYRTLTFKEPLPIQSVSDDNAREQEQ